LSQTDVTGHLDDPAYRLSSRAMTGQDRKMAPLGPTTVAVHDDSDMEGELARALCIVPGFAGPPTIAAMEGL
jgi:hypothetical protein